MYWVNGTNSKNISLLDRTIHFGDGFFTTALFKNGVVKFFDCHIERLIDASKKLFFNNINVDILKKEILLAVSMKEIGVIKVLISRGNNDFGYSIKKCSDPIRIIYISNIPKHYSQWYEKGIKLNISPIRISRNKLLSGIKHNNRLEQVLIHAQLDKDGMNEALVLDNYGYLVECCSANIFWRYGNNVYTPLLKEAGINGIMRNQVINQINSLGYSIKEIITKPEVLAKADEVFITNCVLQIASVHTIGNWHYSDRTLSDKIYLNVNLKV